MSASARILCAALPAAALLVLAPCCQPGAALAAGGDCAALFELYRSCHDRGVQADSSLACLEASYEAMTRFLARSLPGTGRKNPQAAQVLVELVCSTGCEDAVSLREPATRQEFTQAFCD